MSLLPILKKELLEIYRSKKLLILAILFLFVAVSSPILAKALPTILKSMPATPGLTINVPEPTWRDAIDQLVKNISQIIMIVIVFVFAGTIADEKNKKTLEIVLTKPISRVNFILAKFISSFLAVIVCSIIASLIFYAYTTSIFTSFSFLNFAFLTTCITIFLLIILSITVFASSFSGSQIIAAGFAFLMQIVLLTILPLIKNIKNYLPGYPLDHYKELMANGNFHDFLPSIFCSIVLIIILLFCSIFLFKKQEIER